MRRDYAENVSRAGLCAESARRREKAEDRFYLAAGLVLLCAEIWKQYVLTFRIGEGAYQWWYFPFQLCSVPVYLCLLIPFCGKNRGLRRAMVTFLADFSVLSGLIAFLDTSGMHYGYAPLTVMSYLWHIGIAAVGIRSGLKQEGLTLRCFVPAAGIYLGCCLIAELINLNLDRFGVINMFYINPHYEMNQIVFASMRQFLPNQAVIAVYIIMTVLGAFLIHLLWMGIGRLRYGSEDNRGYE